MSQKKRRITIIAAIVILCVAVAVAFIIRSLSPDVNTDAFRVYYDEKVVVPYADTIRSGKVYIDASGVAEYCHMTVSGTRSRVILSSSDEEYAIFTPGSTTAELCGTLVTMPAPAYYDKNTLWLPCEFINSHFEGVDIVIDLEANKLSVYRVEAPESTKTRPVFVKISFLRGSEPAPTTPDIDTVISSFTFSTDISDHLDAIKTTDKKYLLLVNKKTHLGADFVPTPLSPLGEEISIYGNYQLENTAASALSAMMKEMRAAGYENVYVTSAYRDYSYQSALFNTYIDRERAADKSLSLAEARERVLTYSAEPGTSEHQSGLCVDLITTDMTDLDESFAGKPVYSWLIENAHKFGFILRYPEDKVDMTGYSYEPWHYRFVGQRAATEIYLSGLCLEEYLAH